MHVLPAVVGDAAIGKPVRETAQTFLLVLLTFRLMQHALLFATICLVGFVCSISTEAQKNFAISDNAQCVTYIH